jgi:hypothetical protein
LQTKTEEGEGMTQGTSGKDHDYGTIFARLFFAFISALFAGGITLAFVTRGAEGVSSWGTGGVWAQVIFGAAMFSFPVAGILIAWRQPKNKVGLLFLGIGLAWGTDVFLSSYYTYGLVPAHPLPGADIALAIDGMTWVPAIGMTGIFLLLLFPTGRLLSPRWRPFARFSAAALVLSALIILLTPGPMTDSGYPNVTNPLGIESLSTLLHVLNFVIFFVPICLIGSVVSLIKRFRRSIGVERLQMTWIAAAAGVVAATFPLAMFVSVAYGWITPHATPLAVALLQDVSLFSLVLIPTAAGFAILKHRLYDIDVIVNRTIVYGLLSALLVATYLGLVVLLQQILAPITAKSDLAVAASTLAVAALFTPLKTRVQGFIDHRFYRHKYDVTKTLHDFAQVLREEVDLDALSADLLAVVRTTMEPSHAALWLRSPGGAPHEAT